MSRDLEPGMHVRLIYPERGYRYAELVRTYGLLWLVRLSSGYEFTLYETDFEIED